VSGLRGRGASPDMTVAGPGPSVDALVTLLTGLDADSGA